MAIDPNSISPDDVRKLVVEGLQIGADGSFSASRFETSSDPKVAEREIDMLLRMSQARRDAEKERGGLSPEAHAQAQAESVKLKAEIKEMLEKGSVASKPLPLRPSTMQQSYDGYIGSKKKIAKSTKDAYGASFDLFVTLMGGTERMAHDIAEVEFMVFNDALDKVPVHAAKRGIPLKSAEKMLSDPPMGKDKDGNPVAVEIISGETANLHCTNLQGLFDYIINSGRRDGDNPFVKLPRHSDGEQTGGADGFDENELVAIFNPEIFMLAKRPTQFWGPLLALYTGARLNEIACLDLADFVTEKGIPCISIRHVPRAKPTTIEHKSKKRAARQTKNAASRRLVPLHPDLYEIGIDVYMDDMRSIGATRFFPTLPADARGKRERRISHDGNEYLKTVGVHIDRIKVMHSFRDTVCEMLGVANMDEVSADHWTGHKPQSVKGRHYRRSKAAVELQARDGFKALDFPFIDLEKLQYRPGWWNEWTTKNLEP